MLRFDCYFSSWVNIKFIQFMTLLCDIGRFEARARDSSEASYLTLNRKPQLPGENTNAGEFTGIIIGLFFSAEEDKTIF